MHAIYGISPSDRSSVQTHGFLISQPLLLFQREVDPSNPVVSGLSGTALSKRKEDAWNPFFQQKLFTVDDTLRFISCSPNDDSWDSEDSEYSESRMSLRVSQKKQFRSGHDSVVTLVDSTYKCFPSSPCGPTRVRPQLLPGVPSAQDFVNEMISIRRFATILFTFASTMILKKLSFL